MDKKWTNYGKNNGDNYGKDDGNNCGKIWTQLWQTYGNNYGKIMDKLWKHIENYGTERKQHETTMEKWKQL